MSRQKWSQGHKGAKKKHSTETSIMEPANRRKYPAKDCRRMEIMTPSKEVTHEFINPVVDYSLSGQENERQAEE